MRHKPTKYRAKKTEYDGIEFASRKECARYKELKLLEQRGIIQDLRLQVPFELIPAQYEPTGEVYKRGEHAGEPKMRLVERKCEYLADFVYTQDGELIVEDAKGKRTKEYIIKRKLMLFKYGIKIKEV